MIEIETELDIARIMAQRIDIHFSEWTSTKTGRVKFYNILKPELQTYKKTNYYVFEGEFTEQAKWSSLSKGITAHFWITQQCFERAINRHVKFNTLRKDMNKVQIIFDLHRTKKKFLEMKNVIIHKWGEAEA